MTRIIKIEFFCTNCINPIYKTKNSKNNKLLKKNLPVEWSLMMVSSKVEYTRNIQSHTHQCCWEHNHPFQQEDEIHPEHS